MEEWSKNSRILTIQEGESWLTPFDVIQIMIWWHLQLNLLFSCWEILWYSAICIDQLKVVKNILSCCWRCTDWSPLQAARDATGGAETTACGTLQSDTKGCRQIQLPRNRCSKTCRSCWSTSSSWRHTSGIGRWHNILYQGKVVTNSSSVLNPDQYTSSLYIQIQC